MDGFRFGDLGELFTPYAIGYRLYNNDRSVFGMNGNLSKHLKLKKYFQVRLD